METGKDQSKQKNHPSYWVSVLIGGFTSSVLVTIVGFISVYIFINTEPSGTLFGPQAWLRLSGMVLGAVGGFIAIRHYVQNHNSVINWRKGALIGLYVGVFAGILATILTVLWLQVDMTLLNELKDATVANIKMMNPKETNIPEAIEMNVNQIESMKTFTGNLIGAGIYSVILGVLNAISGLIGAKIYQG